MGASLDICGSIPSFIFIECPNPVMLHGSGSMRKREDLATIEDCMLLLVGDKHLACQTRMVCCDGLVVHVHQVGDAVLVHRGRWFSSTFGLERIFIDLL